MPSQFMSKKRLIAKILWLFLFFLSMCIGAQVYAYKLGYPATYLIYEYNDYPIYRPDAFIAWSLKYGWEYTSTLSFGMSLVVSTFLAFAFANEKETTGDFGSSRWMKNTELIKLGFTKNTSGVCLGMMNTAKVIPKKGGGHKVVKPAPLVLDNEGPHYLIIGPTGKGKGVSLVLPTLLKWKESCLIYDIKKENWEITSGYRKKISLPIIFEPADRASWKWNPLFEIEEGDNEIAMTQSCAEIICYSETPDHWSKSARATLVTLILYVLHCKEGKDRSLFGIRKVLVDPERTFEETLEIMLEADIKEPARYMVRGGARKLLDTPEKERGSVISTLLSYLEVFLDPIVAENTSSSDFSVLDLVKNVYPLSIYHVVSPADQARLMPITRIFFSFASQKIMLSLEPKKHKALFLIDEFPSLGKMEDFEKIVLPVGRGYGIRACLICQSFSQLYRIYGRDTSIPSNCNIKVILGANDINDAKDMEDYLGQGTISKESHSRSGEASSLMLKNKSTSSSEMARSLMTKNEIMQMDYEDLLILVTGQYPYKGKKNVYYADKRFSTLANKIAPESKEIKEEIKKYLKYDNPWGEGKEISLNGKEIKIEVQTCTSMSTEEEPKSDKEEENTANYLWG